MTAELVLNSCVGVAYNGGRPARDGRQQSHMGNLGFIQFPAEPAVGEAASDVLFKFGLVVCPIARCLFIVSFAISRLFTVSRAKRAEIKQALLERRQGASTRMSEET